MRFFSKTNLKQLVERSGPLGYRDAARYIEDVATQLNELHSIGGVHRDICPDLMMLDGAGRVRLQSSDPRLDEDDAVLASTPVEKSVLEAADYLSPEQALNSHRADPRTDIYSLGYTLYFLLTGHAPFSQGSISERLLKHQVAMAPDILVERPNAPSMVVKLCERMMSKKPEDRPQTAIEVATILRMWISSQDTA